MVMTLQPHQLPCAPVALALLAHLLPAVPHVAEPTGIASDAGPHPRDWAVVQPPPQLAGADCVLLDQCELDLSRLIAQQALPLSPLRSHWELGPLLKRRLQASWGPDISRRAQVLLHPA
jgi:hypothetical protein